MFCFVRTHHFRVNFTCEHLPNILLAPTSFKNCLQVFFSPNVFYFPHLTLSLFHFILFLCLPCLSIGFLAPASSLFNIRFGFLCGWYTSDLSLPQHFVKQLFITGIALVSSIRMQWLCHNCQILGPIPVFDVVSLAHFSQCKHSSINPFSIAT